MTVKRIASVICVAAMFLAYWTVCAADDQPPAAPLQIPQESFDYKEKKFVFEDWHGVFFNGAKIGWRHILVSAIARGKETAYLYESSEHLQFSGEKALDVEIKAVYAEQYFPLAYQKTVQMGDRKSEIYAHAIFVNNTEPGPVKSYGIRRTADGKTTESSYDNPGGEGLAFDFALPCYFRANRVDNPEAEEFRSALNIATGHVARTRIAASPLAKQKVAGADAEARELYLGFTKYYFNKLSEPIFVVDYATGFHLIRGNEADAKGGAQVEPGYEPDQSFNGDLYSNGSAGFSVKRPSAAWSMSVMPNGSEYLIWMTDLAGDATAFGMVLPGIPQGVNIAEANENLQRLFLLRMGDKFPWKFEFGAGKPGKHDQPGHTRMDTEVKVTSGIVEYEGTSSVILNGNVVLLLVYFGQKGTLEQDKDTVKNLFDSVRLTPVDAGKKPEYENKAKGFKVVLPSRLWSITETDTGLQLSNPWYQAYGHIATQPLPDAKTTLDDLAKSLVQMSMDMGQTPLDENGIVLKIDKKDARMFILEGPMPVLNIPSRSRLYVTMNGGVGYLIVISLPVDSFNKDAGVIDSIINSFKFVKP